MAESLVPPAVPPPEQPPAKPPVVVKKYANRRLYNTETSSYITLDNLAEMIRAGRDFVVYDAKSGEDITRGVLTQIIVEEESKGSAMLPTAFLRQLIGFYGGSLQGVVPRYLEQAMSNFAVQQQQVRQVMQQTFSPFLPAGVEEIGRQNMAMIERAMAMFNPFLRGGAEGTSAPEASTSAAPAADVAALTAEVEHLRAQLAIARAEQAMVRPAAAPAEVATAMPELKIAEPIARPVGFAEGPAPGPAPEAANPTVPLSSARGRKSRSPGPGAV